jgi:hypothetical protein
MTCKARAKGGCPLDEDLREEMLLGREVVVQRAESNIGFLGHVLDLDALLLVAFQQHESRIDDALTACQLIFGQQVRRYRFGHVRLVLETSSRRSMATRRALRGRAIH